MASVTLSLVGICSLPGTSHGRLPTPTLSPMVPKRSLNRPQEKNQTYLRQLSVKKGQSPIRQPSPLRLGLVTLGANEPRKLKVGKNATASYMGYSSPPCQRGCVLPFSTLTLVTEGLRSLTYNQHLMLDLEQGRAMIMLITSSGSLGQSSSPVGRLTRRIYRVNMIGL